MSSRQAWGVVKGIRRQTAGDAAKRTAAGDQLVPLGEAGDACYWCGDRRSTRLRVGRIGAGGNLGYGTYCVGCKADGSGKIG